MAIPASIAPARHGDPQATLPVQRDAANASYKQRFRVGDYLIDPGALSVHGAQGSQRLKPKAMGVLVQLAAQPGVTVTRDELLEQVWKSLHVTPDVVGHAITALRRAFADPVDAPTYIETIPRIGYRLLAPVAAVAPEAGSADAAVDAPPAEVPGDATRPRARRRWGWLAAAAALAALAAGVVAWSGWRPQPGPDAPWLRLHAPQRITFAAGSETTPRLDPQGRRVAYVRAPVAHGPRDLMLQSVRETHARTLLAGEPAQRLAWSADGTRLGYVRQGDGPCELQVLAIATGMRTRVFGCSAAGELFFDWNPSDARRIAFAELAQGQSGGSRIGLLVDDGGWKPRSFDYAHGPDHMDLDPRFSPDGKTLAFRRGANPTSDLYVVSASGGAVRRLTRVRARISGFDWLPDGSGLVFSSDHAGRQSLYAVDLGKRGMLALGIQDASFPDIAPRAWSMAFQIDQWRSGIAEAAVGAGGAPAILAPSSGRDRAASLSPDDARLAFVSDRDGGQQLWLLERASGALRRLTNHRDATIDAPAWSADGQRLLYVLRARGRHQLRELDIASGAVRRLVDSRASLRNAVYAGDAASVWYAGWDGRAWRLHRCARAHASDTCRIAVQAPGASRVERTRLDGAPILVLQAPQRSGEVVLLRESDLSLVGRRRLPANDGWGVRDGDLWYFPAGQAQGTGPLSLQALSLGDGRTRLLARIPGMRLLRYSAPQATRDGKRLLVPVVLEDNTDIGLARIVPREGG